MEYRVGEGIDIHKFTEGRPLILGGVNIPHNLGLDGHSDADALIHALIDGILGATGKGDIGKLFPDTEKEWKDSDSKVLLRNVWEQVTKDGWQLVNFDSTILTEQPKISPHTEEMRITIAKILDISIEKCSIKATTGEKMGFIGREEGLMARCVVMLSREVK